MSKSMPNFYIPIVLHENGAARSWSSHRKYLLQSNVKLLVSSQTDAVFLFLIFVNLSRVFFPSEAARRDLRGEKVRINPPLVHLRNPPSNLEVELVIPMTGTGLSSTTLSAIAEVIWSHLKRNNKTRNRAMQIYLRRNWYYLVQGELHNVQK